MQLLLVWRRPRVTLRGADGRYRAALQVEVAFREQTAGHNALLLLVALSHELLEERLRNAFLDVHARAAEVRAPPRVPCYAEEGRALLLGGSVAG